MTRRSGFGRIVLAPVGVLLVALAWLLFAPLAVGGSASYAIVSGSSMTPTLRADDLTLLRTAGGYRVGDVVAYRSETLGTVVLHRIVGQQADRFVMKGDNNSWTDTDRPTQDDVIGKLWFRIPALGGDLRRPWFVFAVVSGSLLAGVGLAGGVRRRSRRSADGAVRPSQRAPHPGGGTGRTAIATLGVTALAFTALGVVSFMTPSVRSASSKVPYRNTGSFVYTAAGPSGPVYPHGRIATGDPVYLRLVPNVDVSFAYRFESVAPHEIGGTVRLLAQVSTVNGWSRTITLGPSSPFTGDEVAVEGRLNLDAISALVNRVQNLTGVIPDSYELDVVPEVDLAGTVAGVTVHDAFSPHLPFKLDALQLQLQPTAAAASGPQAELLRPAVGGSVTTRQPSEGVLSAVGRSMEVEAVRRIAVAGTLACLIGLAAAGASFRRRRSWVEARRIEARYRGLLIPVRLPRASASNPVDVADMETLVRLAEHYDCLILHGESGNGHDYIVEQAGVTYRYRSVLSLTTLPSVGGNGNGNGHGGSTVDPANGPRFVETRVAR